MEQQDVLDYALCFSPTFTAAALRGIVGTSTIRCVLCGANPHANPNAHSDSDRYAYSNA